ncbi:MAG TPA: acyclic terpene utilization AtuA family protein, partial [Gemmatimonadaceae bacterium]|nr:acyclic terpene utilization AtuA family protein [Gemmatimonadaceae bacterium]
MTRIVRVASGQGFWGDWLEAPRRQVEGGPIDYLMLDYLAEVTMSILQKQKERDPNMGYARDFVGAIESVLPAITERGVRVIANAGGVNPPACAAAIRAVAAKAGAAGKLRVGVVTGDDLLPRLDRLLAEGHALAHMETGEPLSTVRDRVLSANAYIGSVPIVEALRRGANVVVTGRSTDTALTMAPLRFEFGWDDADWNRLAAGIIAGHIIECGAQCSGGNCLHDWRTIPDLANVGYPIVEAQEDGSFVVTKHPGTGGRIDVASVSEQLVYEMGDPHSYITPDV